MPNSFALNYILLDVSSTNTYGFVVIPPANQLRASQENPLKGVEAFFYSISGH